MRHIKAWGHVQTLYMPCVASLQAKYTNDHTGIQQPEHFPLLLPSALGYQPISCNKNWQGIKWQLWICQAHNALKKLCQVLQSHSYMLRFKDKVQIHMHTIVWSLSMEKSTQVPSYIEPLIVLCQCYHNSCANQDENILSNPLKIIIYVHPMTEETNDCLSKEWRCLSWVWLVCGYGEGTVEGDSGQDVQDGMLYCPICMVLTWTKSQPFVLNGARPMLGHTSGKRRWSFWWRNSVKSYSFFTGRRPGG